MPGLRRRASTIRPRAGSGMECRRGPMAVNLLSTIRRHAADDSMVHATLGLRPPATIRRARIPRVAWTVRRRRYRTIVKFRLRMRRLVLLLVSRSPWAPAVGRVATVSVGSDPAPAKQPGAGAACDGPTGIETTRPRRGGHEMGSRASRLHAAALPAWHLRRANPAPKPPRRGAAGGGVSRAFKPTPKPLG
jgi:hypothetical protein